MGRQGSVLITGLWIMTVLAFLAVALGIRSRMESRMMNVQLKAQMQRETLESGVQLARLLIESDNRPDEDSKLDSWHGIHRLSQWIKAPDTIMEIEDEESRLNINTATAHQLRTLFEILKSKGVELETSPEDLASSIVRWRGDQAPFGSPSAYHQKKQPFESLEELMLVEKITVRDYESLKTYLTVFGRQGERIVRINLNTVSNEVLEAVIKSLAGDDFTKSELYHAFLNLRQATEQTPFLRERDMAAEILMTRLGVSSTVLMVALVNQFLQYATVDSVFFRIRVQAIDSEIRPSYAEGVIGPTGGRATPFASQATIFGQVFFRGDNLDLLSWQEGTP